MTNTTNTSDSKLSSLLPPPSSLLPLPKGAARNSTREFVNFLYISLGSISELDTQLELSKRFGYISASDWSSLNQKLQEADRVIIGLIKAQKAKLPK